MEQRNGQSVGRNLERTVSEKSREERILEGERSLEHHML